MSVGDVTTCSMTMHSDGEELFEGVSLDGGLDACDKPSWGSGRPDEVAATWLSQRLARPVQVTFTNNRSTMMSWKEHQGILGVRLHKMFAEAPELVWEAMVSYLGAKDVVAGRVIDRYIQTTTREVPTRQNLNALGRCYDLREILASLNTEFFHDACKASITWGRAGSKTRRKSIILGSYSERENLIRIHPCLDQSFVPRYYISWVIYHEMLHEVLGVEEHGGRRLIHPPEFVILEESYPDFVQAKAWEQAYLPRLLKYRQPN